MMPAPTVPRAQFVVSTVLIGALALAAGALLALV